MNMEIDSRTWNLYKINGKLSATEWYEITWIVVPRLMRIVAVSNVLVTIGMLLYAATSSLSGIVCLCAFLRFFFKKKWKVFGCGDVVL